MNDTLYNPYIKTLQFRIDTDSQEPDEYGIVDRYFLQDQEIVFSMDNYELTDHTTGWQILQMLSGGMEGDYDLFVYDQKNNKLQLVENIMEIFAQCKLDHSFASPTYTCNMVVVHFPVNNGSEYDDFDHVEITKTVFEAGFKKDDTTVIIKNN